jgi:hypothetical protein
MEAHYRHFEIEPVTYAMKNRLGFAEGNVVKYVTRYKHKGGLQDLHKAKRYIDLLILNYEPVPEEDAGADAHAKP